MVRREGDRDQAPGPPTTRIAVRGSSAFLDLRQKRHSQGVFVQGRSWNTDYSPRHRYCPISSYPPVQLVCWVQTRPLFSDAAAEGSQALTWLMQTPRKGQDRDMEQINLMEVRWVIEEESSTRG